jgi:hypothetical protein
MIREIVTRLPLIFGVKIGIISNEGLEDTIEKEYWNEENDWETTQANLRKS